MMVSFKGYLLISTHGKTASRSMMFIGFLTNLHLSGQLGVGIDLSPDDMVAIINAIIIVNAVIIIIIINTIITVTTVIIIIINAIIMTYETSRMRSSKVNQDM